MTQTWACVIYLVAATWAVPLLAQSQGGTVAGRVVDAGTGAPLAGVTVEVQNSRHSVQTDADGAFRLLDVPAGRHALFVSTIGYSLARPLVEVTAGATVTVTVPLAEGTGAYTERVTVTAEGGAIPDAATPVQQTMGSAALQSTRSVLLDDPFRAVQALPGVVSNDDFRSNFSIRGADFSHVGVSIDGVAAPSLLHDFEEMRDAGSMAIINSDILDRVTLAFGTHPQRFGDRTGPWIDFNMREGSRAATETRGAVSGTSASLLVEGPLGQDAKGSWLVSVRRSYIDWLVRRVVDEFDVVFGFTDVEGKFVYDVTPRHQLQLTAIAGRSRLTQDREEHPNAVKEAADDLGIGILALRSTIGPSLAVSQRLSVVGQEFRNENPFSAPIADGTYRDLSYRADATWTPRAGMLIEAGGHTQHLQSSRALREYVLTPTGPFLNRTDAFDKPAHVASGFVHATVGAGRRLTVAPGVRVSRSSIVNRRAVSPWLEANWALAPALSLRAGTGVYHQFPEFQKVFGRHASASLRPEHSRHLDVAIEHRLTSATRWQLTFYDRQDEDFLRVEEDYRLVNGSITVPPVNAPYVNSLSGRANGAELFVQRQSPRGASGWLSYSWSHTTYRDTRSGETFDGDFDQRHTMNLYAQYPVSSRTSVSGKLLLGSNFPIPGYWDQNPRGLFVGEVRNAVRLPAYARLDLRANRVFNYTKRRLTLFVEVMNVLNRANVRATVPSLSFTCTRRPVAGEPLPCTGQAFEFSQELFPRLPSAGILIEF